jgi:hypothetical protein
MISVSLLFDDLCWFTMTIVALSEVCSSLHEAFIFFGLSMTVHAFVH